MVPHTDCCSDCIRECEICGAPIERGCACPTCRREVVEPELDDSQEFFPVAGRSMAPDPDATTGDSSDSGSLLLRAQLPTGCAQTRRVGLPCSAGPFFSKNPTSRVLSSAKRRADRDAALSILGGVGGMNIALGTTAAVDSAVQRGMNDVPHERRSERRKYGCQQSLPRRYPPNSRMVRH